MDRAPLACTRGAFALAFCCAALLSAGCEQNGGEGVSDKAIPFEDSLDIPLTNDPGLPYTADGEARLLASGEGELRASPSTVFCSHESRIGSRLQNRGVKLIGAGDLSAVLQRLGQAEYFEGEVRTHPASSSSCDDKTNSIHFKTLAFISGDERAVLVQLIAWQGDAVRSAYVGLALDADDLSTRPLQRARVGPPTLEAAIQQNINGLNDWLPSQIASTEEKVA